VSTSTSIRIAVVEDDSILREELCSFLTDQGFIAHEVMLGLALDSLLLEHDVDLVLLDVNLPGESGFDIAHRLKRDHPDIGILMLTARTTLSDRVKSYESGVDIYLPKPTPAEEILAALKSVHRRLIQNREAVSGWTLVLNTRQLIFSQRNVDLHLTMTEVHILATLIHSKDNKIDADSFCAELSKKSNRLPISRRALENSISRLRKKIYDVSPIDGAHFIDSVWGYGYQLCVPIAVRPGS